MRVNAAAIRCFPGSPSRAHTSSRDRRVPDKARAFVSKGCRAMSTPFSRRDLLTGGLMAGVLRQITSQDAPPRKTTGKLVANDRGGYSFLPGTPFFSFLAVASPGFEMVRAVLRRPPLFPEGLAVVERHLHAAGRPVQALSGFELRNGRQSTMPEFMAFNQTYIERMGKADVLVKGQMPLTRSNLVLQSPDTAHRIHAFTYTVPASSRSTRAPTFVLSGIPEVRFDADPPEIVAPNDNSLAGLQQKTVFVLDSIERLLREIGAGWSDVTDIQLYTVRDLHPLLESVVLPKIGDAARRGIQWHYVLLPVAGGDVEIDVRSVRTEFVVGD